PGGSQPPAGAPMPPDPMMQAQLQAQQQAMEEQRKVQMVAEAIQLLKDEKLRGFRIDIETDSTIQPDQAQNKAAVTEFMVGVTKYLDTAGMITMQSPSAAPMLGKMLLWAVRRYRVGRDLETAIEEFTDTAMAQAKELAANPRPDPEQIKADAEIMKARSEIERQAIENAGERANSEFALESKRIELQMRNIDLEIKRIDHNQNVHKANMSMAETQIDAAASNGEQTQGQSAQPAQDSVHPHVLADRISKAAENMLKAAELNAKPRVVRHSSGKTSVIEPAA